jgi:hypothetical protein
MPPDENAPLPRPPSRRTRFFREAAVGAASGLGTLSGALLVKVGRGPPPATPGEALWFVGKLVLFFSAVVGVVVFIATRGKRKPKR